MTNSTEETIISDKRKRIVEDKFNATDEYGSKQSQPLNQDWVEIDNSYFSYSDANTISISGLTPSDKFQEGDKIKITQTTDKYFYITVVDDTASTIRVDAGDDYSLANAAIDRLYISRLPKPYGHPVFFSIAPNSTDGTLFGSGSLSITGTANLTFYMREDIIYLSNRGSGTSFSVTGTGDTIYMELPFQLPDSIELSSIPFAKILDNFTEENGVASVELLAGTPNKLVISIQKYPVANYDTPSAFGTEPLFDIYYRPSY